jgi:hypothetical protein
MLGPSAEAMGRAEVARWPAVAQLAAESLYSCVPTNVRLSSSTGEAPNPAIIYPDHPAFITDETIMQAARSSFFTTADFPADDKGSSPAYDCVLKHLRLRRSYHNWVYLKQRLDAIEGLVAARSSAAADAARGFAQGAAKRTAYADEMTTASGLTDMTDDVLLAIMATLPCRIVRGPLLAICRRLHALASSSAALGGEVDVAFLSARSAKAVGPVLDALAKLNVDGNITAIRLGNSLQWGATSTAKLLKLFPRLEDVDFGNTKKVLVKGLADWSLPAAPELRSFSCDWAAGITPPMLRNLVRDRAKLEHISIAEQPDGAGPYACVTDTFFIELGRSCPSLKRVILSGDFDLADDGVRALADGCRELELLSMSCVIPGAPGFKPRYPRLTQTGRLALCRDGLLVTLNGTRLTA